MIDENLFLYQDIFGAKYYATDEQNLIAILRERIKVTEAKNDTLRAENEWLQANVFEFARAHGIEIAIPLDEKELEKLTENAKQEDMPGLSPEDIEQFRQEVCRIYQIPYRYLWGKVKEDTEKE